MRVGGWAISMNERDRENKLRTIMDVLTKKSQTIPFTILKSLENYQTYEQARLFYQNVRLDSTAYIQIAGLDQGVVISKDYQAVQNQQVITDQNWFIVQTNYDVEEQDEDGRKQPCIDKIIKLGQQNIHENTTYDILSQHPNFQINTTYSTIQTAVINVNTDYYYETMWI